MAVGQLVVSWLWLAATVWLTARFVPGMRVEGAKGALLVAALFGLLNLAIGWLLIVLVGIATFGLGFLLLFVTRWIVNAILLKITDALTDKLTVDGFGVALVAALLMSALGTLGEWLLKWVL